MARELEPKSPEDGPTNEVKAPVRLLIVLFAAFAGSLALKVWDERVSANQSILAQQAREALAIAGHVRSELSSVRGRMEGLLDSQATASAIREGVGALAVKRNAPPDGVWAVFVEDVSRARVFAKSPGGVWWSADVEAQTLLPAPLGPRSFTVLAASDAAPGARFAAGPEGCAASACAPVGGAGIAVCVERAAPLFTFDDYNRIAIYLLLLAGPGLAVWGLARSLNRAGERLNDVEAAYAARLADQEQTFQIGGQVGFWQLDMETKTFAFSRQAAELLGSRAHTDIRFDAMAELVATKDRPVLLEQLRALKRSRHVSAGFQGVGRRASNYFEIYGGETPNGVNGVIMDVTDKVRAQLRSQHAERLLRMAVDAYPGPFAAWDRHRRLVYWNRAFIDTFKLEETSVRRGVAYDTLMAEASGEVRVERPIGKGGDAREILLISDRWISFVDRKTSGGGLISVGSDITHIKRHETVLAANEKRLRRLVSELDRSKGQAQEAAQRAQEATVKAERASRSKSVFLANMSHELRTPLNAINGFSEMLVKELFGPLGDERYKGYAEDILQSGQHLLDMINDILDMAKIEAGKMSISPRQIDPLEAVDAAVRLIQRRALDKDVELSLHADEELPEIDADHRAIKQMVLNLVSNAIKFTDPGGRIDVEARTEGDEIAVRVKDSGIGIPAEDLPRLAQPFEQASVDESRNSQGTGLGLALTKSFAEMHGGRLEIESEFGEGTTVSFYLPINRGPVKNREDAHASAA